MRDFENDRGLTSPENQQPHTGGSDAESDVRSILPGALGVDRRGFLKLMGSALAVGAIAGCQKPTEKIIPYLNQPPEMTPGVASWYATTCHGCSAACGALAKVLDGRPVKFEGNPDHAVSRGGLCAVGQAAPLGLYYAGRQTQPSSAGGASSWEQIDSEITKQLSQARDRGGKVVVLTGTVTGPAALAAISDFVDTFGQGRHIVYDALSLDAIREAYRVACGRPLIPSYRFDRADVIVSFGADFLGTWLSPVEFAKQYSAGRSPDGQHGKMSRHFQFESRMSLTGSNADHRYAVSPSEQAAYVAALAAHVAGELGVAAAAALPTGAGSGLATVARALLNARSRSLVVSDSNDASVQAAVLLLNAVLGNEGETVDLSRPSQQRMGQDAEMAELIEEMQRGDVDAVLIHGCNPAYTYPDADEFTSALGKVECSVSFACTPDETAAVAKWHSPADHPMEAWGDAEPQDGRLSLFQPTIRPLYDTRAFEDSLLKWSGEDVSFHEYLKRHWRTSVFPRQTEFSDFQSFWDAMLQRGFIEVPPSQDAPSLQWGDAAAGARALATTLSPGSDLEVEVFETVALREGAAAGNAWLQELPDPITKITWDNYAAISHSLASDNGIAEGQLVDIQVDGGSIKIPAHIQPGQHARTVSIGLGYGRTRAGAVGDNVGVSAYPLVAMRGGRRQTSGVISSVSPTGESITFARTQTHDSMEGRPLVQEVDHSEGHPVNADDVDLWKDHEHGDYKWGMVIDLAKCMGCSACVTACDVENNVAVVGREEVGRRREMHWIRIDRYFTGDPDSPQVVHQPMLCQQCANASCETVCPVLATVHDDQGLSVQIYNRCVGTRYCENNCPYKVRRFNFFNNTSDDVTQNLALNPDVTVRTRGVMEKCSFCLQRLEGAKAVAKREGRVAGDGEVQTACQQSCPADAITFGNMADRDSQVSKLIASPRAYRVLEELNRRPSIHYLKKVRNTDEGA